MAEVLNCGDNVLLEGFGQCEKYFAEIKDIIRREFTLKKPLKKISAEWKKKILATNCAVSVHVRHGDYLRPKWREQGILPVNYYRTCLEQLKPNCPNLKLFVFYDDLQWCKKIFKFDVPTEFVEGCEHDYEEIFLMSLCKHNIISNSTFAWWGAWLNKNFGRLFYRNCALAFNYNVCRK